jgi:hypothetical protein
MTSLNRSLLILVPTLLVALLFSATPAFASSQFLVGAKKATATSTKVRQAVTQATNLNGPRAEARAMGLCLSEALDYPGDIKTGQFYTMVYYAIFDISAQTYRAIPGTLNWGAAVLDNSASQFHGPNKVLKRGLRGLRGQMLIGKSFPASDFCGVVADWEAAGYTGAKALIAAEIGSGVYDRTLNSWTKSTKAIGRAEGKIYNEVGPGLSVQFSIWPQARIISILTNSLWFGGDSIGVTEG